MAIAIKNKSALENEAVPNAKKFNHMAQRLQRKSLKRSLV
jgi:hypothetical protein